MIYYLLFLYDFIIIYIKSILHSTINYGINKKENNIYVSLTTIPSRSKDIIFTINSILNQTIIPNKIFITISKNNIREKYINYKIPDEIKKNPLVEIIEIEKDNGPITKLYGGLLKCNHENDIIITVDDDSIYNRYMIENILNYSKKYQNQVIGTIGRIDYKKKIFGYDFIKPFKVRLLEGYGGVGYRKKFFDIKDIDTNNLPKEVIFNDDIYLSYLLKNKDIELIIVPSKIKEPVTYTFFTEKTNPLWNENENNGLYDKCIKTLKIN